MKSCTPQGHYINNKSADVSTSRWVDCQGWKDTNPYPHNFTLHRSSMLVFWQAPQTATVLAVPSEVLLERGEAPNGWSAAKHRMAGGRNKLEALRKPKENGADHHHCIRSLACCRKVSKMTTPTTITTHEDLCVSDHCVWCVSKRTVGMSMPSRYYASQDMPSPGLLPIEDAVSSRAVLLDLLLVTS